jgi:hypothetical protein
MEKKVLTVLIEEENLSWVDAFIKKFEKEFKVNLSRTDVVNYLIEFAREINGDLDKKIAEKKFIDLKQREFEKYVKRIRGLENNFVK